MDGYQAETYGELTADIYDELHSARSDQQATVDLLAGLAGDGSALELAIGTGRIALPLGARGVRWTVSTSPRPWWPSCRPSRAGTPSPSPWATSPMFPSRAAPLVFVVFNSFFALVSQEEQVRCFANVAAHLTDDGVFVIEAFVPDPTLTANTSGSRAGPLASTGCSSTRPHQPRHPGRGEHARPAHRGGRAAVPGRPALRLAGRAGPHGAARGPPPTGPLGGLAAGAVRPTAAATSACTGVDTTVKPWSRRVSATRLTTSRRS